MKEELRKELMKIRNNLSESELLEKSELIKKRLFEMKELQDASTILFYVSYDNEVFTHDMIKEYLPKGKNVVVPISDKENRRLILSKLESWDALDYGTYGILEPKKDSIKEVSLDSIDIIIVPGVAFDRQGYRLGHGKGYYDGLLAISKKALHIGLAFELQIVNNIPVEKHDVKVDKIVTEKRIITCL